MKEVSLSALFCWYVLEYDYLPMTGHANTSMIYTVYKFFYWAILDARSGAGLAREVILYVLLSI